MSLSSAVFPIGCMENITEIKVPFYLRFHTWPMNDLVEKYPVAIWWNFIFFLAVTVPLS